MKIVELVVEQRKRRLQLIRVWSTVRRKLKGKTLVWKCDWILDELILYDLTSFVENQYKRLEDCYNTKASKGVVYLSVVTMKTVLNISLADFILSDNHQFHQSL